jgi:uncharacterized membrane protein YjgN (DUF898 family)
LPSQFSNMADRSMDNASPPLSADGRSAVVIFSEARGDFFRLVRRGALLELITAGFYRFWLATDIRRMLWSNTSIEGNPFEYTGTGKELFIGFLFALAILVPIYVAYFLIGIEVERFKAFASLPLILFFYAFGQFAIFRARRYRATRTIWRGVRFWMTGSGWNYAWRACLWGLFALVTLGLALPWRESALEKFKMRHMHYGDLQGRFVGTGWDLFKRGWWLWLLLIVLAVLIIALPAAIPAHKGIVALPIILLLIFSPFAYSIFNAIVWRWWVRGIRFAEISFESDLRATALIGTYWAVIGWMLLITSIDGAVISAVVAIFRRFAGSQMNSQAVAVLLRQHPYMVLGPTLLNYLVLVLCLGVVMRVYLIYGVWERVVRSATVHRLDLADNVTARGDLVSALGEGFGQSLDVVGF